MNIDFIILAAGKGTRMGGDSPKVLMHLAGKPMLQHLIDTVDTFPKAKTSIIVGYKFKEVIGGVASRKKLNFFIFKNQILYKRMLFLLFKTFQLKLDLTST